MLTYKLLYKFIAHLYITVHVNRVLSLNLLFIIIYILYVYSEKTDFAKDLKFCWIQIWK